MKYLTMENLPDEILLMIFSHLASHQLCLGASQVCRRWKRLISTYVMRVERAEDMDRLPRGLRALLVTGRVPAFSGPAAILSRVAIVTSRLRELTLSVDYALGENDFKVLETLPHLRHLDIFSKKSVLDISTSPPPEVTCLVVNDTMAPGFLRRLQLCNRLEQLHMYGRSALYPVREMVSFLREHSTNLRELTLRCSEMTDCRYEAIGRCVGLVSLQLHSCSMLTARGAPLATRPPRLRRLHLTGCRMLRVHALYALITNLPPLVEELNLSCSWFGDEHCALLAAALPDLRALELWRCRVGAVGLLELAGLLPRLELLDTDLLLQREQIQELEGHKSLRKLRCSWNGQLETKLSVTSAQQVYPGHYLRGDGEGPRADLAYYWTRGLRLPGPRSVPPGPVEQADSSSFWEVELWDWSLYPGFPKKRK